MTLLRKRNVHSASSHTIAYFYGMRRKAALDGNLFMSLAGTHGLVVTCNQQRHTSFIVGECPTAGFIAQVAASL